MTEDNRLDHVTITCSDFAASVAFYDAALGALGLTRIIDLGDEEEEDAEVEAAGWGAGDRPEVWLVVGLTVSHRAQFSLRAPDPASVRAFFAAAIAHDGTPHDAPRRWPIYRRGYFIAQVADPDGNLIEAVSPE